MNIHKRKFGFTLIELMVVIAIVGILVALAIPSYSRFIRKSNRGEAQEMLMNWANNQEIWRSSDTDYATTGELPAPTHARYTFTLPTRTANTYTLQAVAGGDQAADVDKGTSCTTMTLNSAGTKTPADCW